MTALALVGVRVLVDRALSLPDGRGGSVHHIAGDELELPVDEAAVLEASGYIEHTEKANRSKRETAATSKPAGSSPAELPGPLA